MVKHERVNINLSNLKPPERNIRIHPEKQIKEIIKSLDKFGQCRDIVIDENNIILAGNGLWEAMKLRGDKKACTVRLIGLSEKEKLKFMLADNKTFSLGVEDLEGINEIVTKLGDELDIPGYDEETLKMLTATAEDVTDKIMRYGTIDESEINEIKVKGERKEEYINKFQNNIRENEIDNNNYSVSESVSVNRDNLSYTTENLENNENKQTITEVRKSIICPKCGERIWL